MPQLKIDIAPDGNVTIEAQGYIGPACKQATEAIERALGKVTKSTPTPEMFQTADQNERARQW